MKPIEVAVGLIKKDEKLLITRRKADARLGNYWEFPGGKMETGEDLRSCLVREIREELGIEVLVGDEILTTTYDYPDQTVVLHFFYCEWKNGNPLAIGCQEYKWIDKASLDDSEFPPANYQLIRKLKNLT